MLRGRAGRWLAWLVAVGAIVASAHGAGAALVESRRLTLYSRLHARDSLDEAQDRLFGRDYMESIRAVRRRIDIRDAVHFVEEKPPDGSRFFALFHLAPRRLVRHWRLEIPAESTEPRESGLSVMIRVPRLQAPLELVELPSNAPSPKRAREAGS